MSKKNVYIIGHKNPDTDSVGAAIAYAYLKKATDEENEYIPCRAGAINDETDFVLDYFDMDEPFLFDDARTQIMDIDIRDNPGVHPETSLRDAWKELKERNVITLPITEEDELKGVLTIKDLGRIYIDNNRVDLLSEAKTTYEAVANVLDGELVVGNLKDRITKGRVSVGTAGVEFIADFVDEGDVLIVSNREGSHKAAIESGASCLIVGTGAYVSDEVIELANEKGCSIIKSPYDTYIIARLINQSMPVRYAMISENLITFTPDDYLEDIKRAMRKYTFRDFPVIDHNGKYLGMISRRYLLDSKKKRVILVDHNEKSQAVDGIEEAEILEIIDHHRLGNIETFNPVYFRNQPLGSSSTVIFQMALEKGVELNAKIAGILCAGIISDTLLFTSPTTTPLDKEYAEKLAEIAHINLEEFASDMFHAGSSGDDEPESMLKRDFKKYNVDDLTIGICQINFMKEDSLLQAREKISPFLKNIIKEESLNAIFVLMTNIPTNNSLVIFEGEKAEHIMYEAFGKESSDSAVLLEGVVSRKKQFVPQIFLAVQS